MKLSFLFMIFISLISTLACQKNQPIQVQRWSLEQGSMPDDVAEATKILEEKNISTRFAEQTALIAPQRVKGILVAGHEIHGVKDQNGQWLEVSLKQKPSLSFLESLSAQYLEKTIPHQEKIFSEKYKNWKIHQSKVVYFQPQEDADFVLAYEIIAFSPNETDVVRFRFSRQAELLEQKSMANHFVQGEARVFNGRPDAEPLNLQHLPDLLGSGYLKGSRIHLVSDLSQQAYSTNHVFKFEPTESLFDDVQAYYFADRAVLWFEDKLSLQLEVPIEVKVHVGAPSKTNTAFYYDYKIRLGDGDDKTFKNIPRDPTIVSHEVAHAFVKKLSGLPFEGEGGSLNEAFSDYFSAEITGLAQMAGYAYVPGPYKRNLENQLTTADLKGSMYSDSLVVSGTLWDIKSELGSEKTLNLITLTLMHLGPHASLKDFPRTLLSVARTELNDDEYDKVLTLLNIKRGWDKLKPISKVNKENFS